MATKTKNTNEEGDLYVWSGGHYYAKPMIDAKKVLDTTKNYAIKGNMRKLRTTIFPDKYTLEILDPKQEVDTELSKYLTAMFDSPGVRMWPKMQIAYQDNFFWDISIYNQVWQWVRGEYVLTKLRHLPPSSFGNYPGNGGGMKYSADILKGIVINEAGEIEFHQNNGMIGGVGTKQLDPANLFVVRDPIATELPGDSDLIPMIPLVNGLNFTHKAQAQLVNRIGAPSIVVKVTNPVKTKDRDDVAYAEKIVRNWGKDSALHIRPNMEVVPLPFTDNATALKTIQQYEAEIRDYFKPASLLEKQGDSLGGNAAAESDMYDRYARGVYSWMEDAFEVLPQMYLDANMYEGYTAQIHLGKRTATIDYIDARIAEVGYATRALQVNEVRAQLGKPALTPEEIAAMGAEWDSIAPVDQAGGISPFAMINRDRAQDSNERELAKQLRKAGDTALDKLVAGL